ncbi:MAG: Maf family protein [Gammaproteobacteria bacterium]|nr:MAG: Maf family protein [Gammaproteobacteria bacterium]
MLLKQLGIPFEVMAPDVDEAHITGESPEEYVIRLSRMKALDVYGRRQQENIEQVPVLGADTAVVLDGEILGKPDDRNHGEAMLRKLSGKTHEVLSALSLHYRNYENSRLSVSRVSFTVLSHEDIEAYWETGEPGDKAGAYGIQGHAAAFIKSIEGSYSGVVGLPLYELSQMLQEMESES